MASKNVLTLSMTTRPCQRPVPIDVTNVDDPSVPVHMLSIVAIIGDTGDRNQPVLSHEGSQRDCLVSRGTSYCFPPMMYCRADVFHYEVPGLWKRDCLEYKYQGTS